MAIKSLFLDINNSTSTTTLMLALTGANKFDNFWNSTPFFNTLKQEYKFIVPKK